MLKHSLQLFENHEKRMHFFQQYLSEASFQTFFKRIVPFDTPFIKIFRPSLQNQKNGPHKTQDAVTEHFFTFLQTDKDRYE